MPEFSYSNILHVEIGGTKLTDAVARHLVGGWIDFAAGVPGAFELTFRDHERLVLRDTGAKLGSKVVLAPVSDGKGAQSPLLTGEITALESDYDNTGSFTVVRGYDLGHRMLRQHRVQAYRNMTASDIARRLCAKDGVPVGSIHATTTVYDFVTQPNITDWDFLGRLADENDMVMSLSPRGTFQFVKRESAAGAPPVSADTDPLVLKAFKDILRCRAAVTSADQVSEAVARGWDVTAKKTLVSREPAVDNPAIAIGVTPAAAVSAFGEATRVETDVPYDTQTEVHNAASSLADDITASFAELEVTVRGNPKLRPGTPVALAAVGEPFEGKYTVTGARHSFGDGRHYEVQLTVSGRQWRSLYGLASGGGGGSPRLPGVANAVVTDIKDPLKQGRVKLRFPWLDDTYVSDWTRSMQFGGTGGGGLIGFDVDDEVLVAFDRGALDHPYVIGGLYNGKDQPGRGDVQPYDGTSGKSVRHTLADRSGNRLDLLDQRLGTKRGVRLRTGDDRLTINLDRTETEITVDSAGGVSIKGGTSVSVKAGASLSLEAGADLSVKAGGVVSIESMGAVSVRGTAVAVNALGALELNAIGAAVLAGEGSLALTSPLNVDIAGVNVAMVGVVTANGLPVV
ncbi:type IV secretion protein Rhs [Streptacidiphilus pinicola]|uniref:Type IV secretion protein Rhs n=1 Tax=Streptacidiphilus pinicola TaxID=2219663 RepID=A0A2X0JUB3_9ACTN|nr:VgrG-related protein [Streptacidiphilus pinicola]RAG80465.1 type IV secretion protein Rhs [Streptacidiphilus pinicola]